MQIKLFCILTNELVWKREQKVHAFSHYYVGAINFINSRLKLTECRRRQDFHHHLDKKRKLDRRAY